ncbi:MAG: ATP-binding protein [Bacilli bacterium]
MDAIDILKKEVLEDQSIIDFINKHNLNKEIVDFNLLNFKIYKDAREICKGCMGKKTCMMDVYLQQVHLDFSGNNVSLKLKKCPYVDTINEEMLSFYFFPNDTFEGKPYSLDSRKDIYSKMKDYFKDPLKKKGFYLYGPFGTGKTFLLYSIASKLSKMNIKVALTYYPDFVRFIKGNFGDPKVETMINNMKNVDVLMLDDIGGENNTAYIRDEILGPILQYRMVANKPVFITSNYDISFLRDHLRETKDATDAIKGDRIIERIRHLTNEYFIDGKNLRQTN